MSDFQKRKDEIRKLWFEYYTGCFPKIIPRLLSAKIITSSTDNSGRARQRVELTWATPNRKSFEIEVWIPPGTGPFPILLTQPRFYQLPWAEEALNRGYIVCLYPGLDFHHKEDKYPGYEKVWKDFKGEYPEATWASSLFIQSWLGSRALDYLLSNRFEHRVDSSSVAIIGHSRYGKQSIYAAAFDERFKVVVARSSGIPTASSYRFGSRHTFMESVSIEDSPEVWIRPELRTFLGRENQLPIEGNALLGLIAPRHLWLHTAYNDGSEPTFGVERSFLNAKKAYDFLGVPENINLVYRRGEHDPITNEHVKENLNYIDHSLRRKSINKRDLKTEKLHEFDWHKWRKKNAETDSALFPNFNSTYEAIDWMLGSKTPGKDTVERKYRLKEEGQLGVGKWSRDRWNPGQLKRVRFAFGNLMNGNLYFDPSRSDFKGTVIWLHPWNYSQGSNEGYGVQGTTIYWRLAREGYMVVAYDQFGFGDHLLDAVDFYNTHPNWSKLGRAVEDVHHVLDFLTQDKGFVESPIPRVDTTKIFVCGFSFGGMVGLYAAALDKRIAGVASFSGFTPMRTNYSTKPTGGLRPYYDWHGLLPKLGLFEGKESMIPYDYHDVIAMVAPRKCLIYAPLDDRFADHEDVKRCAELAKPAWGNMGGLDVKMPKDVCRFQKDQQDVVIDWLNSSTR